MRSFVALAIAGAASAVPLSTIDTLFMKYIVEHNKSYSTTEEYAMRLANFEKSHLEIVRLNLEEGNTANYGHNFTSDFTRAEYLNLLGLRNMPRPEKKGEKFIGKASNQTTFNWCPADGTVGNATCNAIKNQGSCGSCWAFSTTASMESAHAIFYNTLYSLSEQQLVSCSQAYGNAGCGGGWYYWAWDYATVTPITTEATYPYTSGKLGLTKTCTYVAGSGIMYDLSQSDVATDTASIVAAITQQPVSVAIEADQSVFQYYTSGVITGTACGTNIDHAVVAVGYGNDPTAGPYYVVRNSWGATWGNSGYVWIGQADNPGVCGINQYVAFPTVLA